MTGILRYIKGIDYGPMAQLVRAPPCHGGGREFESLLGRCGVLAQLGEHLPYKQGVTGSSPVVPTTLTGIVSGGRDGPVVQLVRTPACHAGGRGFKSHPRRHLLGAAAPDMLL